MPTSGPGAPPSRRTSRRAQAQRRGFAAFLAILIVLVVVAWVTRPGSSTKASPAHPAGARTGGVHTPTGGPSAAPGDHPAAGTSLPSNVPIKHVVFMVKENRTFNEYFGTYPGAVGSAFGTSLRHGHHIQLKPCYDRQPHDITHGFSSGLYSIDGGKMDGFDIIGDGGDLT